MVMQACRFLGNRAGLATVEFAFLAPAMLGFILLLIAGGRMEWTRQVLQEAADSGARCMAIGGSSCGTTATVQSYTAARAQSGGVLLSASAVTVTSNQTCNGVTGMNSVAITLPYKPFAGLLYSGAMTISASSCFPSIT